MALEIERKYRVEPTLLPKLDDGVYLTQAYLSLDPEVRVRITASGATLTVKVGRGLIRGEFEYAIPLRDAESLADLSGIPIVRKTRFFLVEAGREWIVDRFEGELEGLWLAEVELASAEDIVNVPSWAVEEVTGREAFANQSLARSRVV